MSPRPICSVLDNPPEDCVENDIEENLHNVVHVIASSSDSEDDNIMPENGYQLLPQELDENLESNENIVTHMHNSSDDEHNSIPHDHTPFSRPAEEIITLWNEADANRNQPLDPEEAEKIKEAMAGFTLPPAAVPAWANEIPEEEWKAQLFATIRGKNSSLCPTAKTQSSTNNPGER